LQNFSLKQQQIIREILELQIKTNIELNIPIPKLLDYINDDFTGINHYVILRALKKGARGDYGITYKMNYQTIGVWINCEIYKCKPRDLEKNRYD
jgi:hypothetical protein